VAACFTPARYINPYTDFGFKKLFGEEGSKDLLQDFLNQLVPHHHRIASLSFTSPEGLPETAPERRAIFDIHCRSAGGEQLLHAGAMDLRVERVVADRRVRGRDEADEVGHTLTPR
jgi:hypothetical protein